MTHKQKQQEARKQIRELLNNALPTLDAKPQQAIYSGAVPDEYFAAGNYLLAKAIVDSWCCDRNYVGLNSRTNREFANIHLHG